MKPRRVVVSLKIKTDAKLRNLKEIQNWDNATFLMDCNYFEFLEKPKVTVVNLKK